MTACSPLVALTRIAAVSESLNLADFFDADIHRCQKSLSMSYLGDERTSPFSLPIEPLMVFAKPGDGSRHRVVIPKRPGQTFDGVPHSS